jgi:hypothetical protein
MLQEFRQRSPRDHNAPRNHGAHLGEADSLSVVLSREKEECAVVGVRATAERQKPGGLNRSRERFGEAGIGVTRFVLYLHSLWRSG